MLTQAWGLYACVALCFPYYFTGHPRHIAASSESVRTSLLHALSELSVCGFDI